MVLICISLIITGVEYPFMYLPAVSSLGNVYLDLLPIFLTGLFEFLLLSFMSYLHILDIKPLLEISFENIFFYLFGSFFILLVISFVMRKLFRLL